MSRRAEGAFGDGPSAVDGRVRSPADIEGIVLIVVERHGVGGTPLAGLKDFSGFSPNVRFGSQLEESLSEGSRRSIILQLEAGVERQLESQHEMHRLQIAVGEVGGHLDDAFLIGFCGFRQFFPLHLHGNADDVMPADFDELLGFRRFLPVLDD